MGLGFRVRLMYRSPGFFKGSLDPRPVLTPPEAPSGLLIAKPYTPSTLNLNLGSPLEAKEALQVGSWKTLNPKPRMRNSKPLWRILGFIGFRVTLIPWELCYYYSILWPC